MMRCTAEDFRRLSDLVENLTGEGLYWGSCPADSAGRPPGHVGHASSPVLRYLAVSGNPGIQFEEMPRELSWSGAVADMVERGGGFSTVACLAADVNLTVLWSEI